MYFGSFYLENIEEILQWKYVLLCSSDSRLDFHTHGKQRACSQRNKSISDRLASYFGPFCLVFLRNQKQYPSANLHVFKPTAHSTAPVAVRASTPLMLSSVGDGACSRSAEHVNQGRKVPRRKYGIQRNTRLPSSVPIVGLGCSSFSTFFSSDDSDVGGPLTVDAVSADLPIVQSWIATIR